MKVTAPDGVYLPALGRPVEKGEVVDVPEEVGQSLIEQGWKPERSKAVKRATKAASTPEPAAPEPEPDPATAEQED
jgi:hypothetical protein